MTPGQARPGFYLYTRPLLIAVLLAPLVPVFTTTALYLAAAASGCSVAAHEPCLPGGIDIAGAYAVSAAALHSAKNAGTSGWLLVYLVLTGALAQATTHGFRCRVVRTFATILGAGLVPFALGLASAAFTSIHRCAAMIDMLAPCPETGWLAGIAFYGNALIYWIANQAVPLAALVTSLLALTMGYRLLIGWLVRACLPTRE